MFEVLHQYIIQKLDGRATLSDADFERVKTVFTPRRIRKRQYFLQEGDVAKNHAFVTRGCLRMYRVDDKGQEHIFQFSIENWWAGDRESVISGKPSKYNIEALEDSELLVTTQAQMDEITDTIPAMRQLFQVISERNVIATQNRIHAAISYTAEEKYLDFIQTYPDIFQRVPQQMIASYLGITRETLSRIRKQTAGK